MVQAGDGGTPSFERDIKPLFRPRDHGAMKSHFDLYDHSDVANNADAILEALRSGRMPCDGAWPDSQVHTFQRWIDQGKPQ